VSTVAVHVDADHETPSLRVDLETGTREPAVPNEAAADLFLDLADIDLEMIAGARLLLITGTGLAAEPSRSTVISAARHAAEAGTRVVLDLDVRPACWPDRLEGLTQAVDSVAPSCEIVVGTERELEVATGLAAATAAAMLSQRVTEVITKRGADGASLRRAKRTTAVSGFNVQIEDDLGAGDAFLSAYLDAWLDRLPIRERLRRANAAGALVAGRRGCATAMPTRDEVTALLHR
jgi:5-dehydro-2-deoxygluconokinase